MNKADRDALQLLDAYIEHNLPAFNAPGIVVGLTDHMELLHVGAHGYADLAARTPARPEHLFQIGSISKSFTSILLLQCQERGILDINAPVERYLPWFKVLTRFDEPIRLRHLMSHTAGIITGNDATVSAFCEAWSLRDSEAGAPPGEFFHYSNSGYKVLGLVLQEVLGQGLAEILQENLLTPLGMLATDPVITHDTRQRLAVGYDPFYDDRPLPRNGRLAPATWLENDTADGSICSDAADMCRYLRMLLNRGAGLLSEENFKALVQPVIATDDGLHGEQYSLGLIIGDHEGGLQIGHSGGTVGYYTDIEADLQAGLGVVVLANGPALRPPFDPESLARYALRLLRAARAGQDLPEPPTDDPWKNENAQDFTGAFESEGRALHLSAEGERLVLEYGGSRIPLERFVKDQFYVDHPDFARFLLCFNREEGKVVEAFHGPEWYTRQGHHRTAPGDYTPAWEAYPGHYRCYNPWYPNFRVALRKGQLVFIQPDGEEEPLHLLGEGLFRVGEDPRLPERIRFDHVHRGQAQQAYLSGGGVYCRTFTP